MKRNGLFWGILIVFLGAFLLLQNLGLIPTRINGWGVFWAIVLIAIGVQWLIGGFGSLSMRSHQTRQLVVPIGNLTQAEITIRHGAGRMQVHGNISPDHLLEGSFEGGVDFEQSNQRLSLSVPTGPYVFPFWPFEHRGTVDWNIGLTESIPLALSIDSGASDNSIDLTELKVRQVRIQVGASSTRVTLPRLAGECSATFKAGAASFNVKVPDGVAARIKIQSGLTGVTVDLARFPRTESGYESPDYSTAVNRVDLSVESGVGSVDIS
jgi:hypothetical protein